MIISTSEELRELTGSFYANADFTKISPLIESVTLELERVIGRELMEQLIDENREHRNERAVVALKQAVAYMSVMRYNRLNDLSHETSGRKAKIDRENEARPFEWQLARDDRAHLEEYYRALDRMLYTLKDDPDYEKSDIAKRTEQLIITDGEQLEELVGLDSSPWLFLQMVPYLDESQRKVEKAYGDGFSDSAGNSDILHAARMATALGAVIIMAHRQSLQTLPYGLMTAIVQDGGGNTMQQPDLEDINAYIHKMRFSYKYWLNEMQTLRDKEAGTDVPHLHVPDNSDPHNKFFRV